MINIEQVSELAADISKIEVTQHLQYKLRERKIALSDVIDVIRHGKIIEQYPDDYPFPSCLVYGFSTESECLHIVCAVGGEKIWLITAYYPTFEKWGENYTVRREKL